MSVISDLKFLVRDKGFTNDKFVKQLGGLKRILQFLKLDTFIEKQIKFYRKELNKNAWNDFAGYDEEKAFMGHVNYFEQTLRQEAIFLEQLQRVKRYEKLMREESEPIDDAYNKIYLAVLELEEKLKAWRSAEYTYTPKRVLKILMWVYNLFTSNRPWHVGV